VLIPRAGACPLQGPAAGNALQETEMRSTLEYGMRLLSGWRRPRQLCADPFTAEGIGLAPRAPGIYMLYRGGRLIYVGIAEGRGGIRAKLAEHRRGDHGACTRVATAFLYDVSADPGRAHRDYLLAHMARHGGRLPVCNRNDPASVDPTQAR
jgi:hypothetical protein